MHREVYLTRRREEELQPAIDCKKKTINTHLLMRKTALKFGSSPRRETGPSQVVDKTTTKYLVRACVVTFTLLPVVVLRFVVMVA